MNPARCVLTLSVGAILALCAVKDGTAQVVLCEPIDHYQVKELIHRWNTALQSGDAAAAADEYWENSVLLSTYRAEPLFTRQQKLDYFADFLARRPEMYVDSEWSDIGCNTVVSGGRYTFHMADGHVAKARYLFAFRFEAGRWRISGHHSSLVPG